MSTKHSKRPASERDHDTEPLPKRRFYNLYDAVAGRVTSKHSLRELQRRSISNRDRIPGLGKKIPSNNSRGDGNEAEERPPPPPYAPQDVLFRRKGAPTRFAEKDIYFAHEDLPDEGRDLLPHSDMLKAVHRYASCFYEALGRRQWQQQQQRQQQRRRRRQRQQPQNGDGHENAGAGPGTWEVWDERTMDETALLAFGILLEEAGRETLGKRGDLVFTEGVLDDDEDDDDDLVRGGKGDEEEDGKSKVKAKGKSAVASGARPEDVLAGIIKREEQRTEGRRTDRDDDDDGEDQGPSRGGRRPKRRRVA